MQALLTHRNDYQQSQRNQQSEELHGCGPSAVLVRSTGRDVMKRRASDIEFYTVLWPSIYGRIGQWVPKVVSRPYVEDIWLCLRTPMADTNGPDVSIEAIGQRHRTEQNVTSHHAMPRPPLPNASRKIQAIRKQACIVIRSENDDFHCSYTTRVVYELDHALQRTFLKSDT